MNKLTDAEIVKSLECCGDENNCAECPLKGTRFELDHSCAEELMKSAAELLESKNAKIEELQHKIMSCNAQIDKLKGRIESVEHSKDLLLGCFKSAGDIAIKKFMDRLVEQLANNTDISIAGYQSIMCDVENILKEMESD